MEGGDRRVEKRETDADGVGWRDRGPILVPSPSPGGLKAPSPGRAAWAGGAGESPHSPHHSSLTWGGGGASHSCFCLREECAGSHSRRGRGRGWAAAPASGCSPPPHFPSGEGAVEVSSRDSPLPTPNSQPRLRFPQTGSSGHTQAWGRDLPEEPGSVGWGEGKRDTETETGTGRERGGERERQREPVDGDRDWVEKEKQSESDRNAVGTEGNPERGLGDLETPLICSPSAHLPPSEHPG